MSANKSKNTKPELLLRKALWAEGIKGYRIHSKLLPGKPDIAFISKKVALFINGCFWHRCPYCNYQLPKNNTAFWQNKFEKNVERDNKKITALKEIGWTTITIWECELQKNHKEQILKVQRALNKS
jgi:DNA mismatch endonuclease (patch repair protein)